MNFPYPIKDNSIDIIYLRNVIEHFKLSSILKIMRECSRVLNTEGQLIITVPHVLSLAAFTDITHKSYFTFGSGYFWNLNNPKAYYKELDAIWTLMHIKCKVTWFDWKRPRLKIIDRYLSTIMEKRINRALLNINNPSLADRLVKKYAFQFVEISWTFQKAY